VPSDNCLVPSDNCLVPGISAWHLLCGDTCLALTLGGLSCGDTCLALSLGGLSEREKLSKCQALIIVSAWHLL
jgi:hypothetical protein